MKILIGLLSPHQPWIFLPGVILILLVLLQSIIFLTDLKNQSLNSQYILKIRFFIVIILLAYFFIVSISYIFRLVIFGVFGESSEYLFYALFILAVFIATALLFRTWLKGSRIASSIIIISILLSTFYLINYRTISIYEPLALAGFSPAQLSMAKLTILPMGSSKKRSKSKYSSRDWYEIAAANGNSEAAYLVGVKNRDRELLRSALEHGNLKAAVAYRLSGSSTPESLYWLEQAAEKGIPDAMSLLGYDYLNGHNREKDILKGIELKERAANAGHLSSMWFMAIHYAKGDLKFIKDNELSEKWELRALKREKELIKLSEELRKTANIEIRPDLRRIKQNKFFYLRDLKKYRAENK